MDETGVDQPLQPGDQFADAVRGQIEAKQLDRDEPLLLLIVGAEDRAMSADADLMKHTKWTERVGWHGAGSFSGQRVLL
jgi:hypothetical protein